MHERCRIVRDRKVVWNGIRYQFVARAIGPSGPYEAGQSRILSQGTERQRQGWDELVRSLASQGWRPIGSGRHWWDAEFAR
jgi:hypothetical protein